MKIKIMPFILLIKIYQYALRPLIGGPHCRYSPSCSEYSIDALKRYGLVKGIYISVSRLLRCNPWGGHGKDPLP